MLYGASLEQVLNMPFTLFDIPAQRISRSVAAIFNRNSWCLESTSEPEFRREHQRDDDHMFRHELVEVPPVLPSPLRMMTYIDMHGPIRAK